MTTSNLIIAGAEPSADPYATIAALKNKAQALGALSSLLRQALSTISAGLPAEDDKNRAALAQLIEMSPEQALDRLRGAIPQKG